MSVASKRANGRASGPVLTSLFLFVPDHSAMVGMVGVATEDAAVTMVAMVGVATEDAAATMVGMVGVATEDAAVTTVAVVGVVAVAVAENSENAAKDVVTTASVESATIAESAALASVELGATSREQIVAPVSDFTSELSSSSWHELAKKPLGVGLCVFSVMTEEAVVAPVSDFASELSTSFWREVAKTVLEWPLVVGVEVFSTIAEEPMVQLVVGVEVFSTMAEEPMVAPVSDFVSEISSCSHMMSGDGGWPDG